MASTLATLVAGFTGVDFGYRVSSTMNREYVFDTRAITQEMDDAPTNHVKAPIFACESNNFHIVKLAGDVREM
jgi:hypothetical protein